jgi:hypothetical protein
MKTNTLKDSAILLFFVTALSCDLKCRGYYPDQPPPPMLLFSIVDEKGNNLFFGKDSIYDPRGIKVVSRQGGYGEFYINGWRECFSLTFDGENTYVFHIEFIPDRIDTMKIEGRFSHWVEDPQGCQQFRIYKGDLFFNNAPICINCSTHEIYKIELK